MSGMKLPTKSHWINPWKGASRADIAHTREQVKLIFELAGSALMGQLENLRENLPIGDADFSDAYRWLEDLRDELDGHLEKIENQYE